LGYYVVTDSKFGNSILPAIPRYKQPWWVPTAVVDVKICFSLRCMQRPVCLNVLRVVLGALRNAFLCFQPSCWPFLLRILGKYAWAIDLRCEDRN
jgi:hypothetical protein